jgi:hypothetical protein
MSAMDIAIIPIGLAFFLGIALLLARLGSDSDDYNYNDVPRRDSDDYDDVTRKQKNTRHKAKSELVQKGMKPKTECARCKYYYRTFKYYSSCHRPPNEILQMQEALKDKVGTSVYEMERPCFEARPKPPLWRLPVAFCIAIISSVAICIGAYLALGLSLMAQGDPMPIDIVINIFIWIFAVFLGINAAFFWYKKE